MPKETMTGISFQLVDSDSSNTTATANHMTATIANNPTLGGRRPTTTGFSGFKGLGRRAPLAAPGSRAGDRGAPPFGVTRPLEPGLRVPEAMEADVSARRLRRRR